MAEPREIDAAEITRVVRDLCIEINYEVPEEMVRLVKRARELEESPLGRQVLDLLIRNQELAAEGDYPYCQDTGYTVIFLVNDCRGRDFYAETIKPWRKNDLLPDALRVPTDEWAGENGGG